MIFLRKNGFVWVLLAILLVSFLAVGAACAKKETAQKPTVIFGDGNWDSIQFHNYVARIILENGYGYKTDAVPSSTPVLLESVKRGDIHVAMEFWSDMHPAYAEGLKNGEFMELGVNFDDNAQGLYVPTVIIKGDPAKGIEPLAPDLKSISDLPKYWKLFKDPEDPTKGRILGSIPGWVTDEQLRVKVKTYGLDKTFNYFSPGSDTALASALAQGATEGKPVVGYYWEPTWLIGKYDLTLLDDFEYTEERWEDGYHCEFPQTKVTVMCSKDFPAKAPDVVEFLKKYKTSSALTSEALAYMFDNKASTEDAARWFLKQHEEVWTPWVSKDVADKVKQALK